MVICPYCGETQTAEDRCKSCAGLFEPLSRQATHNAMGPWWVRDLRRPHQPGCSYETLVKLIERGSITKLSILRGPTTKQFWTIARRVPGVSHLLGYCHQCDASVDPGDHGCHSCGVPFGAYLDRNFLGLPEIRPLPWEADGADDMRRNRARSGYGGGPVGLSSFATDEELTESGNYPAIGGGAPSSGGGTQAARLAAAVRDSGESPQVFAGSAAFRTPMTTYAAAVAAPQVGAEQPRVPEGDHAAGVAVRAMQRQLAAQQRTIRTLIIVTAAVTLIALLLTIGASAGWFASKP